MPRLVTRPQQSASDSTILVARSALLVWVLTPWWMLVLNELALIPRFSWQESNSTEWSGAAWWSVWPLVLNESSLIPRFPRGKG